MDKIPGLYQLHIWLPQSIELQVGRLGLFLFPSGQYIYTGSAMNGVEQRIARHQRSDKRFHWHIDYLLEYGQINDVTKYPGRYQKECLLNAKVLTRPDARIIAPRFGASDCRCVTHLVYLEE